MAQTQQNDDIERKEQGELKGTFVSVLMLGGFVAVSWLVVFILYIVRNGG